MFLNIREEDELGVVGVAVGGEFVVYIIDVDFMLRVVYLHCIVCNGRIARSRSG
jgi:hypothetical protein